MLYIRESKFIGIFVVKKRNKGIENCFILTRLI